MSRFSTFSPLGLAYVAAVTPDTWEVKIADENFQEFEFEDADLVAITALRCPPFLNPRKDRRFDTSSY